MRILESSVFDGIYLRICGISIFSRRDFDAYFVDHFSMLYAAHRRGFSKVAFSMRSSGVRFDSAVVKI